MRSSWGHYYVPWIISGDSPYWLYTRCSIGIGYSAKVAGWDKWHKMEHARMLSTASSPGLYQMAWERGYSIQPTMKSLYSHVSSIWREWSGNETILCFYLHLKLYIQEPRLQKSTSWTQRRTSAPSWLRVCHVSWFLYQFKNKTHMFSFLPTHAQNTEHTYPQWALQEMRLQLQLCPPHHLPLEASPRQPDMWHDDILQQVISFLVIKYLFSNSYRGTQITNRGVGKTFWLGGQFCSTGHIEWVWHRLKTWRGGTCPWFPTGSYAYVKGTLSCAKTHHSLCLLCEILKGSYVL